MKFVVVLLAIISLAYSAPEPKKIFHENFEDFLDLIEEEAGHDLNHLMEHYLEFEEFLTTWDYLESTNFKDLVYEMEDLPEFKAILAFLNNHNIDIYYFIDRFNAMIVLQDRKLKTGARHTLSGRDFSSFVKDAVAEFPKAKLSDLFDEKVANDEEFRAAIESLQTDEWKEIYDALWANEVFLGEVATLAEKGIKIDDLLNQLLATFGQN